MDHTTVPFRFWPRYFTWIVLFIIALRRRRLLSVILSAMLFRFVSIYNQMVQLEI